MLINCFLVIILQNLQFKKCPINTNIFKTDAGYMGVTEVEL